ncbi:hypothetical protein BGZ58_006926, partial [Dissophora ornata]
HKVEQFFTSTDTASSAFNKVIIASPDTRTAAANDYYKNTLSKFIEVHKEHLKKNGSNGHYIGDSNTLADLKTTQFIDCVISFAPKGADEVPISAEKTPNLWKLRETVNSTPSLAAFKNSERCKELNASTRAFFK